MKRLLYLMLFVLAHAPLSAAHIAFEPSDSMALNNALPEPEIKNTVGFDLGFVLSAPDKAKMGRHLIWQSCGLNPISYTQLTWLAVKGHLSSLKMQQMMDVIMHTARPNEPQQTAIVDQNGHFHANIDCDHMNGTKPGIELYKEIEAAIALLEEADSLKESGQEKFFKNSVHKKLVEATLKLRYTNHEFYGTCFKPIPAGVALLEKCVANPRNQVAILSNWGKESFPSMMRTQANAAIFKHFKPETIFVSGDIGFSKPQKEAYDAVTNGLQVDPKTMVFIDDQIVNINAAQEYNWGVPIHLKDGNYAAVEAKLKELGIIT